MNLCNEGMELLREAVVRQAITDYEKALTDLMYINVRLPLIDRLYKPESYKLYGRDKLDRKKYRAIKDKNEVELFFRSELLTLYTETDGEYYIQTVRENVYYNLNY